MPRADENLTARHRVVNREVLRLTKKEGNPNIRIVNTEVYFRFPARAANVNLFATWKIISAFIHDVQHKFFRNGCAMPRLLAEDGYHVNRGPGIVRLAYCLQQALWRHYGSSVRYGIVTDRFCMFVTAQGSLEHKFIQHRCSVGRVFPRPRVFQCDHCETGGRRLKRKKTLGHSTGECHSFKPSR